MSKNYRSDGNVVTLTAPSGGVVSGSPVLIGSLLVVPTMSAAVGEKFSGYARGVHELAKVAATAATEGADAFWNNTTKVVTPTSAIGLYKIGVFAAAAAAADSVAEVRLNGISVVAV